MKKNYETPILIQLNVELEDVIAVSGLGSMGGSRPGDSNIPFGNLFN